MRHTYLCLLLLAAQLATFSSGVQSHFNAGLKRGPVKTLKPADWCDSQVQGCSECYEEQLQPAAGVPHMKDGDHVAVVRCTACAAPLYRFNADSESCDCARGSGSAYRDGPLLEANRQPGSGDDWDAKDPTSSLGNAHGPADGTDIWEMQIASAAEPSEDVMLTQSAASMRRGAVQHRHAASPSAASGQPANPNGASGKDDLSSLGDNPTEAAAGDRTHDEATNGGNPGAHGHRVRQSPKQRAAVHKENGARAQRHRAAPSEHHRVAAATAAADGFALDSNSAKMHGHGHAMHSHVRLHGKNRGGQQEDVPGDSAEMQQDAGASGPQAHLAKRAHKHLDDNTSYASSSDSGELSGVWFNNNKVPEPLWDSKNSKHDAEHKHPHPKPHSHRPKRAHKPGSAADASSGNGGSDSSGDDWNQDWGSDSVWNRKDTNNVADSSRGDDSSRSAEERTGSWSATPTEQLVCRACPTHMVSAGGMIGATFCSPCPNNYFPNEMQETCKPAKTMPGNKDTPRKPAHGKNPDSDSSDAEDSDDTPGSSGKQGNKGQDSNSNKGKDKHSSSHDKKARRGADSSDEEPQKQLPGSHSKAPSSKHSSSNTKQGKGDGRSPKPPNSQPQDESDEWEDESETDPAEGQGRKASGNGDQIKTIKKSVLDGNEGINNGSGSHKDTAAAHPGKRSKHNSGSRKDDTDHAAEADEDEEAAAEEVHDSNNDSSESDPDTEMDSERHSKRPSAMRSGTGSKALFIKRTSNSKGQNDAGSSRSAASRPKSGAADRQRKENTQDTGQPGEDAEQEAHEDKYASLDEEAMQILSTTGAGATAAAARQRSIAAMLASR